LVTGRDRQPDRDAIGFELGWPGTQLSRTCRTSDRTDVGARFDLLYGFENTTHTHSAPAWTCLPPGGEPEQQGLGRAAHRPGTADLHAQQPDDFMTRFRRRVIGFQATPELRLGASADLSMAVNWTHTAYFSKSAAVRPAAEYAWIAISWWA